MNLSYRLDSLVGSISVPFTQQTVQFSNLQSFVTFKLVIRPICSSFNIQADTLFFYKWRLLCSTFISWSGSFWSWSNTHSMVRTLLADQYIIYWQRLNDVFRSGDSSKVPSILLSRLDSCSVYELLVFVKMVCCYCRIP